MTPVLRRTSTFLFLIGFLSSLSFSQQQISVGTFVRDPATGKSFRAYDESHALIVGIDAYTQTPTRRSSVSSSKAVKELLMSRYGFREENIIILLNEEARRSVIVDALKKLQRLNPNDRTLIFLSGQGYTVRDAARVDRGYFIPIDGQVDTPEAATSSCISLDDVKKTLLSSGVKHSLMLLDFAVGGLPVVRLFNGMPPPRLGFERIVVSNVHEVFAGGGKSESPEDDPTSGLSYFTSKLIESLSTDNADVNGDGMISATEMAAQTAVKLSASTERRAHPQFGYMDEGAGDFIFILPHASDTSHISISTDPRDAVVFLDNKQMSSTRGEIPVVSPRVGMHTFQVQREGYGALKQEFFINGRVFVNADVKLTKIQGSELTVTISQPDAKIYVDGKFVGMPDHSLTVERIEKGKHTVRAELEGYYADSASVVIEKPVQYTVSLKLKSRNGLLTIRSSEAVVIALNGKELGKHEVVKKEVLPGLYTVHLSGIGYDTYEEKVLVHDTESVEYVHILKRPTLGGAMLRSAIFPGWGQSYSGRHGIVYSGIFLVLAGGAVAAEFLYIQTSDDYTKNLNLYNASVTAADIGKYRSKVNDLNKKRKNYNLYRFGAAGLAGGFYVYNLINVWRNDPADLIREKEAKAKMSLGAGDLGPLLTLSVQF